MAMKKAMFVARRADANESRRTETLEAALITAAFGGEVHLAFIDDGVYQLLPTPGGGTAIDTLGEYDIDHVWVDQESLIARGLSETALKGAPIVVNADRLAVTMAAMDVIVSV